MFICSARIRRRVDDEWTHLRGIDQVGQGQLVLDNGLGPIAVRIDVIAAAVRS